jgi:hypothetical protein
VLRQPHDHHRDLRARLPAEALASPPTVDNQDRHIMTAPPLTTGNPDPHCHWFLTSDRTHWFEPTNQPATPPAKSSLDRHSDRTAASQTPSQAAQQSLRPRRPKATILTAVKSP